MTVVLQCSEMLRLLHQQLQEVVAKVGARSPLCTLQRKRESVLTLGREPGGPPPTEGHSFCHFSKLFEAVKSRNGVGDAITSAPLAALIEPFQMHFAFMESRAAANIYLCCYWLRKTKLGVEGGSEFLTLQGYRRCGQSLRSGLNIKPGVDTMERNQLKVEGDWIVIQSVPGRGRLNAFPLKGKKHRVMEKLLRAR